MNEYTVNGYVFIKFLKVSPDYKVVKGEEYTLMAVDQENNNGLVVTNKNNQYGLFDFNAEDWGENTHVKELTYLIPKPIQNDLNSINTVDDILALPQKDSSYSISNNSYYKKYEFTVQFPIRLKQTKSIDGYKQNSIIYTADLNVEYKYDDNNNIIEKTLYLRSFNGYQGIIQGKDIPTYTKISDISKFTASDTRKSCINTDDQGQIITDQSSCTVTSQIGSATFDLVPYFVNQNGTVNLKITNTVNGLAKYNASKDNNLTYKIKVENTGDASSGNNVIVTNVPTLVEVDESSISDNGTYNSSNHTITWNIAHIEAEDSITVSYRAIAPESAKNKELIGNSTVKSDQITNTVQSTNTIVTLDRIVEIIKNPDTGTMVYIANTNIGVPLSFIIMFILFIAIISTVIVTKYRKKRLSN